MNDLRLFNAGMMTGLRVDRLGCKHKTGFTFSNDLVVILTCHGSLHDREPTTLLDALTFKPDRGADRQSVLVADITLCGISPQSLEEQPIRHDVIQCAENDASMGHIVVATVIFAWCKFTAADIVIQSKFQVQTNRVGWPADKTTVGVRAKDIHGARV